MFKKNISKDKSLGLKGILVGLIILLVTIGTILVVFNTSNKSNIIAHIQCDIPSMIESSTHYTYRIYKKGKNSYTYDILKTEMWISDVKSKQVIESGEIKNKKDLDKIKSSIEQLNLSKYNNEKFECVQIYYEEEKLKSIEELADKLF